MRWPAKVRLLPSPRGGKGQKSPKMTYVLAYVIFFAYLCSRKGAERDTWHRKIDLKCRN